MVHDGGGGESRRGIPRRLRRVVPEGPAVCVVHQAGSGGPSGPPAAPGSPAQTLDLRHDEHNIPQHGKRCSSYRVRHCLMKH